MGTTIEENSKGTPDAAPERYWRTEISEIHPERVTIRGYDLEQLIGMPFGAATFLMIRGRIPTPGETKVMDALLTGVLDYGLEKPGTAAARYVVSSNPSMQAGLAAATLAAGQFSLATEDAATFISTQYQAYVAAGEPDMQEFAQTVVEEAQRTKFRIPGFGHPVFRGEDPRAQRLRSIAVEAGLWGPAAQLYEAIHTEFVKNPRRAHFPLNDIGVLAAMSVAMGFTPEESTALAIIGTLPGVAAHVTEELRSRTAVRVIAADAVDYEVPKRDLGSDLAAAGWSVTAGGDEKPAAVSW
ncbi:citryl-CoA lyase [Paenarthrobacter sp. NPDC058040]|uniref:citryl-CoA lyase n=1 Tax=unclassified Paenarthrobacter TaxID=2634190 RepID=UPI0036DE8180